MRHLTLESNCLKRIADEAVNLTCLSGWPIFGGARGEVLFLLGQGPRSGLRRRRSQLEVSELLCRSLWGAVSMVGDGVHF